MAQKKRGGRKLIRVDEGNHRSLLKAAELAVRTIQEVTDDLAFGAVKLSGFGSKDAARRPASRTSEPRDVGADTVLGSTDEVEEVARTCG